MTQSLDAETLVGNAGSDLQLRNVQARYDSRHVGGAVLEAVSVAALRSSVTAVVGANGCGKSTLLKVISGHLRHEGSVIWRGKTLEAGVPWKRFADGVMYVAQGSAAFAPLSVRENLRLADVASRDRAGRQGARESVQALWPAVDQRLDSPAGVLSAGEYRLLSLGMAFACGPELLLLDEPLAGVARSAWTAIARRVADVATAGNTVLIVEQNLPGLTCLGASRTWLVQDRRVLSLPDYREGEVRKLLGWRP